MIMDLSLILILAFFIYRAFRRGWRHQTALFFSSILSASLAMVITPALNEVTAAWLSKLQLGQAFISKVHELEFSGSQSGYLKLFIALLGKSAGMDIDTSSLLNENLKLGQLSNASGLNALLTNYLASCISFLLLFFFTRLIVLLFIKILSSGLDKVEGLAIARRLFAIPLGIINFSVFLMIFALIAPALAVVWPRLSTMFDNSFALLLIWRLKITPALMSLIFTK
ncbi:MAG: hypothetical protein Q4P65_00390 [Eubacteriales bacterium]|nr:hypothetical protein [Eubacteriales bacterium]